MGHRHRIFFLTSGMEIKISVPVEQALGAKGQPRVKTISLLE